MRRGPKGVKECGSRHESGPDSASLFYACFECLYPDCKHTDARGRECAFRVKWGREHGVDPGYLAGLKHYKDRRGRPRKI